MRAAILALAVTAAAVLLACASEAEAPPPDLVASDAPLRQSPPPLAAACDGERASSGGLAPFVVEGPSGPIEARIHLPAGYADREPVPLVLLFHGGGSNPDAILNSSRLAETADAHGFVLVAAPNGTSASIEAVLDHVQSTWCVDPARAYATGLSAGARISSRLGCELPGRIAAIAPVAGVEFPAIQCLDGPPVPIIAAHGTDDRILAFGPAAASLERWAEHDGCSERTSEQLGPLARLDSYGGCNQGTEAALLVIQDGGHVWFGSPSTREPDPVPDGTNELLWAFLSRHALPATAE